MAKSRSKAGPRPPFLGRWRVASVTTRGRPDGYAEAGAFFEFEADGLGRFRIGDVEGDVDYRAAPRDGRPGIEFSWEGIDATDLLSGRGWAVLDGDTLAGHMLIHLGDESEFTAVRSADELSAPSFDAGPETLPMTRGMGTQPIPQPRGKGKGKGKARAKRPAIPTGLVYRLKITLRDIRPPIWRRLLVPDVPLPVLHDIFQVAMGWHDCHLHEFRFGDTRYSDPEAAAEHETKVADDYSLGELIAKEKTKFFYYYDFGDDWVHEVVVEAIKPPEPGHVYPACVGGKRACPPEDCGGPWAYPEFLAALADPRHPEHRHWSEWAGPFDPETFSANEVNERLRAYVRF